MFHFADRAPRWGGIAAMGSLPLLALAALGSVLTIYGLAAVPEVLPSAFREATWLPAQSHFGIIYLLLGTFATTLIALALSLPLGFGAAIHLALYASPRQRHIAGAAIALLGSMPSVIIGLWGMTWITPVFGNSLISASLVLSLMITPTFCLLACSAFRQVPADVPETVRSLGLSEFQVLRVMLRHARLSVLGALILATSRALGEAVALSMVAGNVPQMPNLAGPVGTLTTTLIVEYDGSVDTHRAALYLLAVIVMGLIGTLSFCSRYTKPKVVF